MSLSSAKGNLSCLEKFMGQMLHLLPVRSTGQLVTAKLLGSTEM